MEVFQDGEARECAFLRSQLVPTLLLWALTIHCSKWAGL